MKERIIELHEQGFSNAEIYKMLEISRSVVAGVIFRYKNPTYKTPSKSKAKIPYAGKQHAF